MDAYFAYVNECAIAGRNPKSFAKFVRALTFTTSNNEKYTFYANECAKAGLIPESFYDFIKDLIVIELEKDEIEEPTA